MHACTRFCTMRASPPVGSVGIRRMNDNTLNPSDPPPARMGLADAVDTLAASTVGLAGRRQRPAAGLVWHAGAVLSAASAIGHGGRLQVLRPDGEAVVGEVRGIDPGTDIALIGCDTGGSPPAARPPADTPPPRVGDFVFAVGRNAAGTVHASFGHVGAAGPAWRTWRGGAVDRLIRLDGGLYPGLAGAPVAREDGTLVGIASPALSRHHGVVLPLATLERVAAALIAHGRIRRGYIGIAVQPVALNEALRAAVGPAAAASGLLVAGVGDDSPAARAGLLLGDVIVAVAGAAVADIEALRDALGGDRIGRTLPLTLLRGGQALALDIEVAEHRPHPRC
jgi:S1-C subfamily serine protease